MFYISRTIPSVAFFHFSCYNDCTINSNLSYLIMCNKKLSNNLSESFLQICYLIEDSHSSIACTNTNCCCKTAFAVSGISFDCIFAFIFSDK